MSSRVADHHTPHLLSVSCKPHNMTAVIELQGTAMCYLAAGHVKLCRPYSTSYEVASQYEAYTAEISPSSIACVVWHSINSKLVAFLVTGKDT